MKKIRPVLVLTEKAYRKYEKKAKIDNKSVGFVISVELNKA